MDSLGRFLGKRYGYAFLSALPIIGACVVIGIFSNVLASYGVSQDIQDAVSFVGMILVLIVLCLMMFLRKPLPGVLGMWQRLWNAIPTWKSRRNERR